MVGLNVHTIQGEQLHIEHFPQVPDSGEGAHELRSVLGSEDDVPLVPHTERAPRIDHQQPPLLGVPDPGKWSFRRLHLAVTGRVWHAGTWGEEGWGRSSRSPVSVVSVHSGLDAGRIHGWSRILPERTAAVVGAGVIGLTTAITAQEAGFRVAVYSDRATSDTSSARAPASFKPAEVVYNDVAHEMVDASRQAYERILFEAPGVSGVRKQTHWEAGSALIEPPDFLQVMEEVEALERPDIPGGYAFAWRFKTFFIDTTLFLPWLAQRFRRNGGSFVDLLEAFHSLEELAGLPHDIVFNCTGLGSRSLCGDERLVPVKGQIVLVDPQPDMNWSIKADGFYVYPRRYDTVLGGTVEWNVGDDQAESGTVDAIVRANKRILPHLKATSIRGAYGCLRPYRSAGVRVELGYIDGKPIIHNYGHGGSGFTLCWGSARRALQLV